eukprot:CAMPEP_0174738022 /NCGR_PEP_ID=MMETSP1094-20130205/69237_1 /TAXON_ID=156173 /ORGANISM="Chrysochromulina brevifilum, Strain UTEX LB 985" /LENGTH=57 /DNA_ID=CAMNT_0015941353 /DNA_START=59 /DNA_END=229 /DNA_ORIENTATION=-
MTANALNLNISKHADTLAPSAPRADTLPYAAALTHPCDDPADLNSALHGSHRAVPHP